MNSDWHVARFAVPVMLLMGTIAILAPPCAAVTSRSDAKYAISEDTVRDTIAVFLKKEQLANLQSPNNKLANTRSTEPRDKGPDQIVVPRLAGLEIPADLMAREKSPDLEVTSIRRDAFAHDLLIRLRCRRRAVCGSFLVMAPPAPGIREFPSRKVSDSTLAAGLGRSHYAASQRMRHSAPVLVEPGKSAVLVLQARGMRITVPVTCLQRGSLNQQVAVRDTLTRKILQAKVVGPGQLRSAF